MLSYYGQGTRNEYRITRFGRGFPFFQDDNVGDLLIIAKYTEEAVSYTHLGSCPLVENRTYYVVSEDRGI